MSDDLQAAISLACLIVTGTLATWGIFSRHYDDTVLQRLGLSIVALGCMTRAYEKVMYDVPPPQPALLWSQIGLCLFAIGTAYRIWRAGRAHPERRHGMTRRGARA